MIEWLLSWKYLSLYFSQRNACNYAVQPLLVLFDPLLLRFLYSKISEETLFDTGSLLKTEEYCPISVVS